jgi:WD40 repeat protein
VSASDDRSVRLWRVADGVPVRTIEQPGEDREARRITLSPDGELLATHNRDYVGRLWRVADGMLVRTIGQAGSNRAVHGIAFSPDGQVLASDRWSTIQLWRVADGSQVRQITGFTGDALDIRFTRDGKRVAVTAAGVWLYQADDGKQIHAYRPERGDLREARFAPDERSILEVGVGSLGDDDTGIERWAVP